MSVNAKMTAIADAIRAKTGCTSPLTLDDMTAEINSIETPDERIPESFEFTGDCTRAFYGNRWNWVIDIYGDKMTTKDITSGTKMFALSSELKEIPFDIYLKNAAADNMYQACEKIENLNDIYCNNTSYKSVSGAFLNCKKLKRLPYVHNAYPSDYSSFASGCYSIREIPEDYFDTWNTSRVDSYGYAAVSSLFSSCYSLRKIPAKALKKLVGTQKVVGQDLIYAQLATNCCSLDELIDLPVITPANVIGNRFNRTVESCSRLKEFTFEMPEGKPVTATWKNQTIDLSKDVGYAEYSNTLQNITSYNSGITTDKKVVTATNYEKLKNDNDWYTGNIQLSRYNHDSAVNTINSLPDTSAYLASAGGTNTIKFKGLSGNITDGGAINKLTAEEIAVATAKGWTVTLV